MKSLQLVSQLAKKLVYVKVSVLHIYNGVNLVPWWKGHWNKSKKLMVIRRNKRGPDRREGGDTDNQGSRERTGKKRLSRNLFSIPAFPFPSLMYCLKLVVSRTINNIFSGFCVYFLLFLVFQLVYFVVQLRLYFVSQHLAIADF